MIYRRNECSKRGSNLRLHASVELCLKTVVDKKKGLQFSGSEL